MRHADDHSHIHAHDPQLARARHAEDYAARAHPEFVALEIGGHLGALIVHTDPDMHGLEVEISPDPDDRKRSHKQVLERSTSARPAFTVVFDRLPAGTYALWTDGCPRARGIAIDGGSITELDWRTIPEHGHSARSSAASSPASGAGRAAPAGRE
jgi:hypothetical protein